MTERQGEKSCSGRQGGFTLFEVMVAVLLLAMVSTMIYSILNVSITFSEKGEKRILALERKLGLLGLLERQIKCAVYDDRSKEVAMSADDTLFRLTTRAPLLYARAETVLAVYRYDPNRNILYYLEKRDFYNAEYEEDYIPDFEEMTVLIPDSPPLSFSYEEGESAVLILVDGEEHVFTPWCQIETRESVRDDEM
ncbi:MAG: PulJ/GspJ family protein [Thermodesulfobacteriota bacterium]